MDKRTVKDIAGLVASVSTGMVVREIIKNNVGPMGPLGQVGIGIGTFVITAMISKSAIEYTEELIDDLSRVISQAQTATST